MLPRVLLALRRVLSATLVRLAALVILGLGFFALALVFAAPQFVFESRAPLLGLAALVLGLGLVFALALVFQLSEALEFRRSRGLSTSKAVAAVLTMDMSAAARDALGVVVGAVLAGAGILAALVALGIAVTIALFALGAVLTGISLLGEFLDVWQWFDRL